MRSIVALDGAAMAEATLCDKHFDDDVLRSNIETAAAGVDDVRLPLEWVDSSDNDFVECVECGVKNIYDKEVHHG